MIDRAARNQLAEQLRHIVSGLNDNFTYDDLSRLKLKAKWALSAYDKAFVLRCILFLKSDQEYQLPAKRSQKTLKWLLTLLTLNLVSSRTNSQLDNSDTFVVWPFVTTDDLKVAKLNPDSLSNV